MTAPTRSADVGSAVAALERAAHVRGWPPIWWLRFRRRQLELVLERTGIDVSGRRVLEIGGGTAGHGALFADLGANVVSSDLPDPTTIHGGPLVTFAQDHADNQQFVAARAEALPFVDSSFDIVFSSCVLEHVAKREQAVAEMWRVLRAGGLSMHIVPNVPDSVMSLVRRVFVYEPRQVLKLILKITGLDWHIFRRHAKPDLAILPHGDYPSVLMELRQSTIAHWDGLFTDAGFTIIQRTGIGHEGYIGIPAFGLMAWLPHTSWIQEHALPLLRVVGRGSLGLWLSPGYVLVARKD